MLVVGAGPAGLRCALRLAGAGVDVVLCGDEPTEPYDRVALGQILAGRAQPRDLVTYSAERLHALGVDFRPGTRIVDIDLPTGRARTAGGEAVAWDRLVLATGSEAIRLPVPGADLEGVFVYRRLADVLALRRRVVPGLRAVVIGGGLLGLEAAGALAGHGARVTVVHAAPWPMERQLDAGAGDLLARALRARFGIHFVMPATTSAIEGESAVRLVRLADGTRLPAELVVMAVGVRPETTLARSAGLPVDRGIRVDGAMRTSAAGIFAIGECAEHDGVVCGLVAPALAMAEVAAEAILGGPARYAPKPTPATLKVAGIGVWSAGAIAPPQAETILLRDDGSGTYRRLWLRDGRAVGAVLVGDTSDAPFFLDLVAAERDVAHRRHTVLFGPAFQEAA